MREGSWGNWRNLADDVMNPDEWFPRRARMIVAISLLWSAPFAIFYWLWYRIAAILFHMAYSFSRGGHAMYRFVWNFAMNEPKAKGDCCGSDSKNQERPV
jgi:hypothetical protein